MLKIPLNYLWVVLVAIATTQSAEGKLYDLSHDITGETPMSLPDSPKYTTNLSFDGDFLPGVYAKFSTYSISEHGATHIDAPRHFTRNGYELHEIPLENTIADGVKICCKDEVAKDPEYELTLQKIKDWEAEYGEIPKKAAVIINFNWSHRFTDLNAYFGTDDVSNSSTYRFPVISNEAIDFLVDERDINILATDTMSPDPMTSTTFYVHMKLLGNNKIITENLKDAGSLPPRGFRFHSSPVKFVGGTGVQIRAFAVLDECAGGGGSHVIGHFVFVIAMAVIVPVFSCLFKFK